MIAAGRPPSRTATAPTPRRRQLSGWIDQTAPFQCSTRAPRPRSPTATQSASETQDTLFRTEALAGVGVGSIDQRLPFQRSARDRPEPLVKPPTAAQSRGDGQDTPFSVASTTPGVSNGIEQGAKQGVQAVGSVTGTWVSGPFAGDSQTVNFASPAFCDQPSSIMVQLTDPNGNTDTFANHGTHWTGSCMDVQELGSPLEGTDLAFSAIGQWSGGIPGPGAVTDGHFNTLGSVQFDLSVPEPSSVGSASGGAGAGKAAELDVPVQTPQPFDGSARLQYFDLG
jgi:hypothetical protein